MAGSGSGSAAAARAAAWPRGPSGRAAGRCAAAAPPPARHDRPDRCHRPRGRHRPVLLPGEAMTAGPRVLLLVPARTYRAADFLQAAARMGLDLVIGSDGALPLGDRPVIPVNPADPDRSASLIAARCGQVAAVI